MNYSISQIQQAIDEFKRNRNKKPNRLIFLRNSYFNKFIKDLTKDLRLACSKNNLTDSLDLSKKVTLCGIEALAIDNAFEPNSISLQPMDLLIV